MSQWLYRGYIFGRPDLPVIHKVDKEGQEVFANEPNPVAGDNDGISQYGTDTGPVSLQNFVLPIEEFEGACVIGGEIIDPSADESCTI